MVILVFFFSINYVIRILFIKLKHMVFFYKWVDKWRGSPGGLNNFSSMWQKLEFNLMDIKLIWP